MSSQQPSGFATLEWHGQRLCARLAGRTRAALDLDGCWFDDLLADADADAEGVLALAFAFAPNGREALDLALRDQRDGALLVHHDGGSRQRLRPPADGEWLLPVDVQPMRPDVAIVMPIHNAAASVGRCLDSVLAHTTGNTRLILIDDASTDAQIAPLLARYRHCAGVEVCSNERNRGFTATVNRGIAMAGRADVVLLNADTQVGPNWLTGLRRAAYARDAVATATAVSDNAGAFSVPELERENTWPSPWTFVDAARAHWQHAGLAYPQLPTGNGFCLYVRRDVFDAIGLLDEAAFPQGYGEENDFCQRASARGRVHVIAGNVFVHHERSMSFGVERRMSLGRAGMQVLRDRWPNYEADVGATLFSFERRVLDWRVRRIHALAPTLDVRPRVLRIGAARIPAPVEFAVWHVLVHDGHWLLHDAFNEIVDTAPIDAQAPLSTARMLQRHAFDLLDARAGGDDASLPQWIAQAERLGIATVERRRPAADDASDYRAALDSTRTFKDKDA